MRRLSCYAVAQTLTYPLELFVARHAIHALFFASEKRFSDQQHYVITLILWGSSLAIALNVSPRPLLLACAVVPIAFLSAYRTAPDRLLRLQCLITFLPARVSFFFLAG